MPTDGYSTIRELLGPLIGKTLVDVSQHDEEDFKERGEAFVCLMFDDGSTVTFPTTGDLAFIIDGPASDALDNDPLPEAPDAD
jgi:hypothetical protein